MIGATRKKSRRKKLNQSKRGGNWKETWLSRWWQSQNHQINRLNHYIEEGNLEKVKIYVNRIKNWGSYFYGADKDRYYFLNEALKIASETRTAEAPNIIYYLLENGAKDWVWYDHERHYNNYPMKYAIRTKNLDMIDKLFRTNWPSYYAQIDYQLTEEIAKKGDIELYKRVSKYPVSKSLVGHSNIRPHIERENERKARLEKERWLASIRGNKELAQLIQSMLEQNSTTNLEIPEGTENAISFEIIKDGDRIVDFDNESSFNRYYLESTYNELIRRKQPNPHTRKAIKEESYHTARIKKPVASTHQQTNKRVYKLAQVVPI